MYHIRLQGSESECGGVVQYACHMYHIRLQDSESECGGVVQYACQMPDFKEVSVMERENMHVTCLTSRK